MLNVHSNLFALGPRAELSRPEPAPTSVAGTPGDPCVFIPTDPCIDASLLSPDVAVLNPQLHPLEELRFFGESKLPFAGPVTSSPEQQRYDARQEIVRPASQAVVGGTAREQVSLKNLIGDDVAHGTKRYWRERVMPYSPADYIGGVGSYPIEGDRMRAPLFVKGVGDAHEVSINDIKQRALNDCHFMGPLAAVAQQDPQRIMDMIADNGDGTCTVTFKERIPYTEPPQFRDKPITVSGEFPGGVSGYGHAGPGDLTSQGTLEIWPLVMEKAFGKYMNEKDPYGWLNMRNTADLATEALTGRPVEIDGDRDLSQIGISKPIYLGPPAKDFDELLSDFLAGKAITIGSGKTPPPPLMAGHCYAVRNVYTDSNGKQWVQLYNPWGVGHPPPIAFEDLERLRFVTA